MSLLLNGSTGYLEFPGRIINNLPGTIVVFTSANITGASQMWAVQQQSNADRYIAAWLDANGTTKYASNRNPGSSISASRTAAPNPVAGSLQIAAAVFASTTSRTMYYGSNTGTSLSASVVDDIVNHDRVTVGAWRYNGGAAGLFTNGEVAEAHFYNVALTATDVENIRTGAVLPEALAGWVDGWTLQNFNAGGTYTSIGGSRTLTAVGGVSAGIRAHPITRSTNYTLGLDNGSYELTGRDVSLIYTPIPGVYSLGLDPGEYLVTGSNAFADYSMSLLPGTYSVTGSDVDFTAAGPQEYTITLDNGSYLVTGRAANLIWSGGLPPGDYSMYTRLVALGYQGQIDNMFLKFLQDRGATSDNLTIAQVEFLNAVPVDPGQINERWFKYWRSLGHTGSYSDMWRQYWNVVGPSTGSTPILDQLSVSAASAYSLRQVRSAASLACRVRRSSDNAELDIGFTALGDLNTAALLAHVGTGNGFVTTWYDQSGNGRNATQTDPTLQPQIVSNGALITENGRPYIDFTGNKGLGSNHNALLAFTAAVLKSDTSVFSQYHAIFDSAAGGRRGGILELNQTYFHNSVFPTAVWKNGTALANPFNLAPITTPLQVSIQNSGVGNVLNGRIGNFDNLPIGGAVKQSENIVFIAVPSTTNRQLIERNQGAYYGISVA